MMSKFARLINVLGQMGENPEAGLADFRREFNEAMNGLSIPESTSSERQEQIIFADLPAELSQKDVELLRKLKAIINAVGTTVTPETAALGAFYRTLRRKIVGNTENLNILNILEEILAAAAEANKENENVSRGLNQIIHKIHRWRLLINDEITPEAIEQIREGLSDLEQIANNKKYIFFANEIMESVGETKNIIDRIKHDIRKYEFAAAEERRAYNRKILDVEKTKFLIREVHVALCSLDENRILFALQQFEIHVRRTLGEEYKHGKKQATEKDIHDYTIEDHAAILYQTIGEDVLDLSIPDEKYFRGLSDAIFGLQRKNTDPVDGLYPYLSLLTNIKNGVQLFSRVLNNRGLPPKEALKDNNVYYDDKYEAIVDGYEKTTANYVKNLFKMEGLKEYLVKNIPLNEISALIPFYLPDMKDTPEHKKIEKAFKKEFADYMITHAYEIYQWQMNLLVGNTEEKIEARTRQLMDAEVAKIPADCRSYIAATQGDAHAMAFTRRAENNLSKIHAESEFKQKIKPAMVSQAFDKSYAQAKKDVQVEIEAASKDICEQYVKNIKNLIEATHGQWRVRLGGTSLTINGVEHKVPRNIAKIYAHCLQADIDKNWSKHFNDIAIIGCNASKPHRFDFFGATKRDEMTQEFYDNIEESFRRNSRLRRIR